MGRGGNPARAAGGPHNTPTGLGGLGQAGAAGSWGGQGAQGAPLPTAAFVFSRPETS